MKNLKDLFEHELKDLYSAESQLTEALPKLQKNAKDDKLKQAFEKHLKETEGHKKRIEEICEELGIKATGETCKAMKGLVAETESFLKEDVEEDVMDAGLIAEAQRVEHYEISGYGTAIRFAKELGHDKIAAKLKKTLDEEYKTDDLLTKMAESRLNKKAK
ncbi:MAG TPA: ferritin-like domain-containing protein [Salinimicrobium sp.]|nr:ferritin-like domain-containing protein [Salinimicrobium sp.]